MEDFEEKECPDGVVCKNNTGYVYNKVKTSIKSVREETEGFTVKVDVRPGVRIKSVFVFVGYG